ncbi:hypothetical protein EDD86DRAFT_208707 [Gorgonomyces haynaldii]|nr:hypothetical protein EDD86DRAFT_208707 [Gorgonomyces haynaldii]
MVAYFISELQSKDHGGSDGSNRDKRGISTRQDWGSLSIASRSSLDWECVGSSAGWVAASSWKGSGFLRAWSGFWGSFWGNSWQSGGLLGARCGGWDSDWESSGLTVDRLVGWSDSWDSSWELSSARSGGSNWSSRLVGAVVRSSDNNRGNKSKHV